MTKEELEKEVEEWLDKKYLKDMGVRKPCKQSYLAGAEPRENRIEELEGQLAEQKQYTAFKCQDAKNTIERLEAQIEKMKNCANCKHFNMEFIPYWCNKNSEYRNCWEKCGEWEVRE